MTSTHCLPHDLLPIIRPLEDTTECKEPLYFYDNVVSKLIPDIVRIENNGIGIDLNKVEELEEVLKSVLENTSTALANNSIMQKFLAEQFHSKKQDKINSLESKLKTKEDFIKEFKFSNKVMKSYLVNTILISIGKESMVMDSWGVKDIKKLCTMVSNPLLQDVVETKETKRYLALLF